MTDNMAGASKPAAQAPELPGSSDSSDVIELVWRFCKKISIVGTVYLVGYMQWSVAWLIGPVFLSVLRDSWGRRSEYRRVLAKTVALSSEKDVVLARLKDLPAWVFFPDIERAEWLNRILLQVWPNVNHFARDLLKSSIEPAVAESLAQFKLKGFKFDRMILGSIAPRVGGVKVYDKNLSRDEIIMDIDLFYAGDCDISFVLGGVKGGIKDLQIHGMMRVVMKPLLRNMPLVGGLQIFFLDNPDLDFNLVGAADVLDMPGLSDILRRGIVEQIGRMMVLPNKFPIKLSDEVPTEQLRMPEPEGVLRIHLVEAKNLVKRDIGMLGKGKSDPYAIITVGAQHFKTKHISNNVNPKFDYWCEALVMQTRGQNIELALFDHDDTGKDEDLGRCSVDISQVVKNGRMDVWQTLHQVEHGTVRLILSWHRLSDDAADLEVALREAQLFKQAGLSTAVLSMYIDSCKNLPNARPNSKPDPYLMISLGRRTENTAVQMRTADPVFEIGHSFLVPNPQNDALLIKAFDQKTSSQLGELSYELATLLRQAGLGIATQPLALHRAGAESKIIVSLCLRILIEAAPEEIEDDIAPLNKPVTMDTNKEEKEATPPPSAAHDTAGPNASSTDTSASSNSDAICTEAAPLVLAAPPTPASPKLVHRNSSVTSSAGEAGLGRIQLTLRYSMQRKTLVVVVHKIMNIPLKDPTNIPDPYVKLYMLPGRSKESKRKTLVMRDNCNPVYDESFEYPLQPAELSARQLEVTVASHKGFLGGSPVIGQVIINLSEYDYKEAQTLWYDLLPETTRD